VDPKNSYYRISTERYLGFDFYFILVRKYKYKKI